MMRHWWSPLQGVSEESVFGVPLCLGDPLEVAWYRLVVKFQVGSRVQLAHWLLASGSEVTLCPWR